ncbi:type I polyketide synthase [Halothiobacillus neapolitanus]|uniref:KR domain protein n=1 Tax=Halothiobacillus neapolitanus (strain ATCC 23641 / DSM 15147 / CIP 104769 / NCIMB 8539 / c2) TaxID=555778 RepID=D0KZC3_HALNC|nr:type I polyketide synthase [Halothiobacillus neapolitanus]ACX95796.1 KR domain protein [Halothiobacillus neapolitanus c2]TDN66106.1 myxalamid-type polyketide synthase MxaB [Halothiobacillus neapolitanus]
MEQPTINSETMVKQLLSEKHEPIAIVGLSLRLSDGISDLNGFHHLLLDGRDNIVDIPESRWDNKKYFSSANDSGNAICTNRGGYLNDIDKFDPAFFSISPKEARYMDPQQRIMLELCWEALENAGLNPEELRGSDGAVYLGSSSLDYARDMMGLGEKQLVSQLGTGTANSAISGRISYFLGWRGPSMTVDTACSSSLVAIHLASSALRNKETSFAIAGGINIVHNPVSHIIFTRANMLAPDGRCKTFDESADGYGRSEGAAVLVLRRLSSAIADGNRILGVIRGSAVRQDGESGGLTVPNGVAQEAVMRDALRRSLVKPADISYVEAHGTGTPLGDPIEIHSINSLFSERPNIDEKVYVASSKTNLGHMEAAAGVGGILKCLAQLNSKLIYQHINFNNPSSKIDWGALSVTVPTEVQPWEQPVRRAMVNSFGFAGTIASLVLEEAPVMNAPPRVDKKGTSGASDDPFIFTVSAKSSSALLRNMRAYLETLIKSSADDMDSIIWTSSVGRQHHPYRWAASARNNDELMQLMRSSLDESEELMADTERMLQFSEARVAFLLTGQGAQYPGMGAGLYKKNRVFRRALDEVSHHFDSVLDVKLKELMFDQGAIAKERLVQTKYTQPALFAFNYAVAKMWMEYGIEPAVMLGHSVGEIVSACLSGLFTLKDAVRMTARRAEVMQSVKLDGAMLAVKATKEQVSNFIESFDDVGFAGFNGPKQTVISGGILSLDMIADRLSEEEIPHRRLEVSHAFHSAHMNEAAEIFRDYMTTVTFHPLQREFISNVTGKVATYDLVASPDYWARHICQPVNFAAGMETIATRSSYLFLETGPSPHLTAMGRGCIKASDHYWVETVKPSLVEEDSLDEAILSLYKAGQKLDWRIVHAGVSNNMCELPPYSFDHESYWLPVATSGVDRGSDFHPLLGQLAARQHSQWTFTAFVAPSSPAYLADHVVMGRTIFPGTGYVEVVLALQDAVFGHTGMVMEDLEIHAPLILADEASTELSTQLTYQKDGVYSVEISSVAQGENTVHFTCRMLEDPTLVSIVDLPDGSRDDEQSTFDKTILYNRLASLGLQYGEQFQRVRSIRKDGVRRVFGTLSTENINSWEFVNPGLFDGVLHTLEPILGADRTLVPVGWSKIRVYRKPRGNVECVAELRVDSDPFSSEVLADLTLYGDGLLVLRAEGLRLREVKSRERSSLPFFHRIVWKEQPLDLQAFRAVRLIGINCPDALKPHLSSHFELVADIDKALDAIHTSQGKPTKFVCFWNGKELPADADADAIMAASQSFYEPLLAFIKALAKLALKETVELVFVTKGVQTTGREDARAGTEEPLSLNTQLQATISGFCSVLNSEFSRIRAKVVDLPCMGEDQDDVYSLLNELHLGNSRSDFQVAYRCNSRMVKHLEVAKVIESEENYQIVVADDGLLSGLGRKPLPRIVPSGDEIEVCVEAAGLNFKDVLNALGLLKEHSKSEGLTHKELPLGFECAGVVTAAGDDAEFMVGESVMISHLGCMQRYVTVSSRAAVRIPDGITMEQAAAIPTAFITSYYALYSLAKVNASDRVLIHAAAGGVGQAALQLCRRVGAEVFATASHRKWDVLRNQGVDRIMDSRNINFGEEILRMTDGGGVSVVLNSLNKDFIPVSLAATAHGGRFVELGKLGVWSKQQVTEVRPDISYSQFDLSEISENELLDLNKSILEDIAAYLSAGEITPPLVTSYSVTDIAEAFGVLSRGENVGKIVLTFGREQDSDLSLSRVVSGEGTYVITGGYGALGQRVARCLIQAGARNVTLLGRNLPNQDALAQLKMRLDGVENLDLCTGDVADSDVVDRIFVEAAEKGRPVCGIVHLAGLISDAPITEQTWISFRTVFLPKVVGTWNLWKAAERHGGVELFAGFSSIASVVGSVSQSNYASANAFIDGLMNRTRGGGRIGLALNWGPWGGAGMAAELTDQQRKSIERKGFSLIPMQLGMEAFGRLARQAQGQVVIGNVDWSAYKESLPGDDSLYDDVKDAKSDAPSDVFDYNSLLALSEDQRKEIVLEKLILILRQVLQYGEKERVSRRATFSDLGIDSLVAVELRNTLEKSFGIALPSSLVFDYPSVPVLSGYLLEYLKNNYVSTSGDGENSDASSEMHKTSEEEDSTEGELI